MSEEEKKAVEILNSWYSYNKKNRNKLLEADKIIKVQETILNLIENQQKELEHYKRLAEMNLKDSEEFKKNMCEHRCILNNQIMELTEELNNIKEIEKSHQTDNGLLRQELDIQIEHNKEIDMILKEIQEENGKLRVELEQEKEKNKTKVDIKDIEVSNFIKERYISKDKIKDFVSEKMKHLYVDSCAEDSGKYTAYKNILNLLGEK